MHSEVKVCRSVTFGHDGQNPSPVTRNRWLRLSCHTALCPRPSLIIFQYVTPCQPFTVDDGVGCIDDRLTSRVDSHSLMPAVRGSPCAYDATLNPRQRCHSFEAEPAESRRVIEGCRLFTEATPLCHD